jgi:hypothetical protein
MALQLPSGGLRFNHNGTNYAICALETPIGIDIVVAELRPDGWFGRWSYGPQMENSLQAEVDAVGSVIKFINTLKVAINNIIAVITGAAAPSPPKNLAEAINVALGSEFECVVFGAGVEFKQRNT